MAYCDIFIGYYRASAAAPASALHRRLSRYFRRERIYLDSRAIHGDNASANSLSDEHVRQSKVILYLITDDKTDTPTTPPCAAADTASRTRLLQDLSGDSGKRFIPILYGGAIVPSEFAMYNAFSLSGVENQLEIAELVHLIREATAESVNRTMVPTSANDAPHVNLIAEPRPLRYADNGPHLVSPGAGAKTTAQSKMPIATSAIQYPRFTETTRNRDQQ